MATAMWRELSHAGSRQVFTLDLAPVVCLFMAVGWGKSAVNMDLRVHEHFKGGAHKCGITRALVMPHL